VKEVIEREKEISGYRHKRSECGRRECFVIRRPTVLAENVCE
jgi:hypothetical protein